MIDRMWRALFTSCALSVAIFGCHEEGQNPFNDDPSLDQFEQPDLYSYAGGCFALQDEEGRWLAMSATRNGFSFVEGERAVATSFFMKAADLATYLLYDAEQGYVVGESGKLIRQTTLVAPLPSDTHNAVSGAEWVLEAVGAPLQKLYRLRHPQTEGFLSTTGITLEPSEAAVVSFVPATACAQFPELSIDAEGTVSPRTADLSVDAQGEVEGLFFDDGTAWGIVEPHTHFMANWGFGGGGVVHGAPYHRLGVEHALGNCSGTHGFSGVKDLFGAVFEDKLSTEHLFQEMLPDILTGQFTGLLHETAGYPHFTDWPAAPFSATHQAQYYKWIERAWMGGLRIITNYAVSNAVICELARGLHLQSPITVCNDMVDVDRQIQDTYAMEAYIDAQSGGPGKGFFRIVTSPAQARDVIAQGKLAVVLGIETSNLFNCFSVPKPGMPVCDEDYVVRTLNHYHNLGIRAIFPVHKFDNAFSAGDGNRGFIEVGNFLNSGHLSNFVTEGCSANPPGPFDKGDIAFAGLNQPRANYLSTPPYDMSHLGDYTALTLLPHLPKLLSGAGQGSYCQKTGQTPLGEFLLVEMMKRGMIVDVDHFSQRAYERAFELLKAFNYPPMAGHGTKGPDNQVYALGGVSITTPGTCRDMNQKGTMLGALRSTINAKVQKGAWPGEAWSWDLNGFAGARGPRFGAKSSCTNQGDPITYPFKSYDGNITFTQPKVGNRTIDFNTEGLAHIGLMPEYIEDLRRDAVSDTDLEPLFRSAEAYLRMWEKAETRGASIKFFGGDACPFNPNKVEPGQCGCIVEDTDTDGDGIADCLDKCPADPNKTKPGTCGCGRLETDTDLDGTKDCLDRCPSDQSKRWPGICGCGIADLDSDGDGVPDCNDLCPGNPDKLDGGVCGCAAAENDADGDGALDCVDGCPADPYKVGPGVCGCATSDEDSDGDGHADCMDECPTDPSKLAGGLCGCGTADTDADGDGTADCDDSCRIDSHKTAPGFCGCGFPDIDADGNGTPDCKVCATGGGGFPVSVALSNGEPLWGNWFGGGGGSAFQDRCPAGHALVGIRGRAGKYVDQAQIVCAPVCVQPSSQSPEGRIDSYQVTTGNRTYGPTHGGNGPPAFEAACPAGEVVTGLKVRSGHYVDNLAVLCKPVSFVWSPGANRYEYRTGGERQVGPFGGNGGSEHQYRCPEGQIGVGDYGASGYYIDRIGIGCNPLYLDIVP